IGRRVERELEPVLPFARWSCLQYIANEGFDSLIDFQRTHAQQRQFIDKGKHGRQQAPGFRHVCHLVGTFDHVFFALAALGSSPTSRNCCAAISLKLRVGFISHSMPSFSQNAACALIERHDTALALRSWSCISSSMFTM